MCEISTVCLNTIHPEAQMKPPTTYRGDELLLSLSYACYLMLLRRFELTVDFIAPKTFTLANNAQCFDEFAN